MYLLHPGYHLYKRQLQANLMLKQLKIIKALIAGTASIEYVHKTPIKRTPGEITECSHN
jgi:hypothetical protein